MTPNAPLLNLDLCPHDVWPATQRKFRSAVQALSRRRPSAQVLRVTARGEAACASIHLKR